MKSFDVIVIGGGETGSDCIGTSNRNGAKSVTNFEIMPKPPITRNKENPWPFWPFKLKTTTSHEEGIHREWSILTKEFIGDKNGNFIYRYGIADLVYTLDRNDRFSYIFSYVAICNLGWIQTFKRNL